MARPNMRIIEKPSLSDWIVFLSDIVNRRQAYLGLIFTSFFSIIVLIFAIATLHTSFTSLAAFFLSNDVPFEVGSMNSLLWVVCGSLLITYGIMLSSYLYQICSKKSNYNRAIALLNNIMKREIITVENVEQEWFRGIIRHNNKVRSKDKGHTAFKSAEETDIPNVFMYYAKLLSIMTIIIMIIIITHFRGLLLLRDYSLLLLAVTFNEFLWRIIPMKKKYMFILKFRSEQVDGLIEKIKSKKKKEQNEVKKNINILRNVTENSLALLGILSGLTLTFIVLTYDLKVNLYGTSIIPPAEMYIFIISGTITFLFFVINLALCYSLLLLYKKEHYFYFLKGLKRYQFLMMLGLIMLGVTFLWSIRCYFQDFFHLDSFVGISSFIVLTISITILYSGTYLFKNQEKIIT